MKSNFQQQETLTHSKPEEEMQQQVPVTSPQRQDAVKGVVPTNTKLSNEWALLNVNT